MDQRIYAESIRKLRQAQKLELEWVKEQAFKQSEVRVEQEIARVQMVLKRELLTLIRDNEFIRQELIHKKQEISTLTQKMTN